MWIGIQAVKPIGSMTLDLPIEFNSLSVDNFVQERLHGFVIVAASPTESSGQVVSCP